MSIHEFPEKKKCFCLRRIDVISDRWTTDRVKKYSETTVWTVPDITFKLFEFVMTSYQSNLTVIGKQHEKAELSIKFLNYQDSHTISS
ncbi:Sodium channel protein type 7 subunit alpha [Frankliniella fusca]|uniref:Sodium channel protein type 7 subunit alpha n=1 Tax=Frankliniella fusca TaxID=407009 RepID=A0AAE1LRX5_9NEOP|nr:Sodium channel protein type 7 subunit alpha [Frankliniella fusca]